jgi:hypothetical protein
MKKRILSGLLLAAASTIILTYSCKKDTDLKSVMSNSATSETTGANLRVNNDNNVVQTVNNHNYTFTQKTGLLIDFDNFGSSAFAAIMEKQNDFGLFSLELIFSTVKIQEEDLITLADNSFFDNNTYKNIVVAQTPISEATLNTIISKRPTFTAAEINSYQNLDRAVNVCDLRMVYAKKIVTVGNCNEITTVFINSTIRYMQNGVNEFDLNIIMNMGGGSGSTWIYGKSKTTTSTDADGTITKISCSDPPHNKCMKVISQSTIAAPPIGNDNHQINLINSTNKTSYEKGRDLLAEDLDEPVLSALIDNACGFDNFVFELLMVSNGKTTDGNLLKAIFNDNISDAVLTNILIVNVPLSNNVKSILARNRKNISVSNIESFGGKRMSVSICRNSILTSDEIVVAEPYNHTTTITYTNLKEIALASTPDGSQLETLLFGPKGTWIRGEQSAMSTNGSQTIMYCVSPPTPKCVKVFASSAI